MGAVRQALPVYGRRLIPTLDPEWFADCVVLCAPEAWALAKHDFRHPPKEIAVPKSMEQAALERQLRRLPRSGVVFGIGGGSACDAAKLFAHLHGARLILAPSVLSVDAPFTKAVGVRVNHRVRYVGEVFPEKLLVDFDLLRQSPARLNRAGVGDVLSIATALPDWRLAAADVGESCDAAIAAESPALLDRLFAGAAAIRDCTENGLKLLAELYVGEVRLCEIVRSSRPEEGTEHYFGYCLESLTRRHFIHGELIAMTVLLVAMLQEQPLAPLRDFLRAVGVAHRPAEVGVTTGEIARTLLALPGYLDEERQLLYGVGHKRRFTDTEAQDFAERFVQAVA